jgi:hypothetical protein
MRRARLSPTSGTGECPDGAGCEERKPDDIPAFNREIKRLFSQTAQA